MPTHLSKSIRLRLFAFLTLSPLREHGIRMCVREAQRELDWVVGDSFETCCGMYLSRPRWNDICIAAADLAFPDMAKVLARGGEPPATEESSIPGIREAAVVRPSIAQRNSSLHLLYSAGGIPLNKGQKRL